MLIRVYRYSKSLITCRGCSNLFSAVRGIQKLELSDTVVRDDAMQAVAHLSNLDTLNLAYSGGPQASCLPCIHGHTAVG